MLAVGVCHAEGTATDATVADVADGQGAPPVGDPSFDRADVDVVGVGVETLWQVVGPDLAPELKTRCGASC